MSDVRPFRGWRPRPDLARQVASPPYDVLNSQEARVMAEGNPYSYLHIAKAEIDLPPDVDVHGEPVYRKAIENQKSFHAQGILRRDATPCFYVYELTMGTHVQTGFVVGASVDEYESGIIKKHELTRKDKEDDRTMHVDMLDANTEPVFLSYKPTAENNALLARLTAEYPVEYDFVADDEIRHRLWVVSKPADVKAVADSFASIPAQYVADGHHRSAAAWRVRNLRKEANPNHTGNEAYNHVLAVTFTADQLKILGYHRVVKDLNGFTPEAFLARLAPMFDIHKGASAEPSGWTHFTMFLDNEWYELVAKPGLFDPKDPIGALDVSILQRNVLDPLLSIKDPRTDKRIDFVGGIRGTKELERRCHLDMKVAFALYPTSMDQLMAIADANAIMPPKSTWFEPKLRSGIFVRSLDDC